MNWPKQRAWGWYATLIRTPWFCVKLLRFKPDGKLSMQRHKYRTEYWIILHGTGLLYDMLAYKTYRTYKICPMEWHQYIACDEPVYVLELQYGKKVTENDIERK